MPETVDPAEQKFLSSHQEYKLRKLSMSVDLWKAVLSVGLVGVAGYVAPIFVEAYKSRVETERIQSERERIQAESRRLDAQLKLENVKYRQDFIKSFAQTGSNQDIELRWRLADYFAHMADSESKNDWNSYRANLETLRKSARGRIEDLNQKLAEAKKTQSSEPFKLESLRRQLRYAYAEMGAIEENQNVSDSRNKNYTIYVYYRNPDKKFPDRAKLANTFKEKLIEHGYMVSSKMSNLEEVDIRAREGQIYIGGTEKGSEIISDVKDVLINIVPKEKHGDIRIDTDELELDKSDVEIYLF